MTDRELMQQVVEALENTSPLGFNMESDKKFFAAITALRERLAQPDAYGYASRLAVAIWEQHYKDVAPQWKPLDDLMGVLTQIDNMTVGLTRLAQPNDFNPDWDAMAVMVEEQQRMAKRIAELEAQPEQEPVAWADEIIDDLHAQYNTDGIKEIDSGDALIRLDEAIAAVEEAEKRHTAPPQRKPLTDEEIERACVPLGAAMLSFTEVARAIEAAHGIKGEA